MTDRELLEKAAKAAGIRVNRFRLDDPMHRDALVWDSARNNGQRTGPWNPLTDDGDALRLAVRLCLHIGKSAIAPSRYAGRHDLDVPGLSFYEPEGADAGAATRRAIVRAAAAIGEQT